MAGLLRLVAALACLVVVISFAAFASDQAGSGSKSQVQKLGTELNDPAPSAAGERARERQHGAVRERVDDANDVLLSPFTGITSSRDVWVRRIVPGVAALLVYGLGLTLLANFLPRRSRLGGDWRAPRGPSHT